jgi:hypothetical protein
VVTCMCWYCHARYAGEVPIPEALRQMAIQLQQAQSKLNSTMMKEAEREWHGSTRRPAHVSACTRLEAAPREQP